MNKAKWELTQENATKAVKEWYREKRACFGSGHGLTKANEITCNYIIKLTGRKMKVWLDLIDKGGK